MRPSGRGLAAVGQGKPAEEIPLELIGVVQALVAEASPDGIGRATSLMYGLCPSACTVIALLCRPHNR